MEAGGLFRLLVETTAVELAGVRRFATPWEAEASLRLRSRDPSVLAVYQAHGRVQGCDRLEAAEAAVAAWHAARSAGQSVVICASDHATVDAVAARVRAGRVAAGDVEPGGVAAGELVVGTGDEIVTCRNDRRLMTTAGAWVRNGDRWVVTERFGDASLAVSSLDGRGAVVLPADYVHNEVTLAYAVTLHKAQGVTVDRAVVVADEATTAEALYVGMTRGRHDNRALVVCGRLDAEHRQQRPDAIEVLTGALKRVSAEQAALEVLRSELAASESLATLAPRLANLDAWIARETSPDPSVELQRLAARRSNLERTARPGLLTRAGRDDRRALAGLDARQEELEAAAAHRYAWCERHAEALAYRDELAAQVSDRRSALGLNAAVTEPPHLVELLGSVPDDPGERSTWAALAGRVEAYREQWGVGSDELGEPPIDGVQYLEWETAVHNAEMFGRFDALGDEHGVGLGCGIDL